MTQLFYSTVYMHMPYYNMTLFSDPWPPTHTHAIMSPALSKKHHPGKIFRFLILWLSLDLWLYPLLHCVFLMWDGDPAWEHNSNLHYNARSCGDERLVNRRSPSKKFSQFSWWFSKISFLCECTTISYSCTFTQKAIYIYILWCLTINAMQQNWESQQALASVYYVYSLDLRVDVSMSQTPL